jgi:hypothetical protein
MQISLKNHSLSLKKLEKKENQVRLVKKLKNLLFIH